ncbi:MAG: hypothetical protein HYR56_13585 [Acidobacteria bacterium]|nr:hypothetical protein [Acidobacteriota bacterium]MBI3421365.1 hypothetical protein [Acidobacteriota bacterium]
MARRKILSSILALFWLSACSGQLYKVATPPKITAPPLLAEATGLSVAAKALSGDEALEQFDANLLLAGLVAVDVRLVNRAAAPLQLAALRAELHDNSTTLFKLLTPKQALEQVMRYYGNRLYAKAAYAQTLASYEALALPLTATLAQQEELRGFLFFETKADATTLTGLTLTLNGLPTPLTLKLD